MSDVKKYPPAFLESLKAELASADCAPAFGSALAIEIETLEYAEHLCRTSCGLGIQVGWRIEKILKRLRSQQNDQAHT